MDYQQLLLALLPDLLVVVALFAALGVDYSRLRGSRLAKRYQVACQISAAGLIAGLAVLLILPDWQGRRLNRLLASTLSCNSRYLQQIIAQYASGKRDDLAYRLARRCP